MKVKHLNQTVNVAWSPAKQYPILLAAGTAAQQLDASFNTSASLGLYSLNLQQPGYEMELKAEAISDNRFYKLIWGQQGDNTGVIVGGCDKGTIKIYSADKMLSHDKDCLLSNQSKHTGPVRAMDFNPFQSNLLATGASESEVFIWDINRLEKHIVPGKSPCQPLEDLQHVAWNKQVQSILALTFLQRYVILDLRKEDPVIKLIDANTRVKWKTMQWHPEIATQLCLASEDDQTPIIELWDLRFASSPLKCLQNHQRGVLSIDWNPSDSDLLLSCAKDKRILLWNPNSDVPNGEVVYEFTHSDKLNFDVSWCPRNPGLVVGTSIDSATVYSLFGGEDQITEQSSDQILDSFPGMDHFAQPPRLIEKPKASLPKIVPKWMKRRCGASFGFGGKLTTFGNEPVDPNNPINMNAKVFISQVITNPEFVMRSNELESALNNHQYYDYCKAKADNATDNHNKQVWSCLNAYFGDNVTTDLLNLLGYNIEVMSNKLNQFVPQHEIDAITEGVARMDNIHNGNIMDNNAVFDAIAEQEQSKLSTPVKSLETNFVINTSDDSEGLITQAILLGNIEAAVSLCFKSKRYADAVILSVAGGPELLARTQYKYFLEHQGTVNSLINSLVSENWLDIAQNCNITCWREAVVGVFTNCSPEERPALCDILGDRLVATNDPALIKEAQICYICSGNLSKVVETSSSDIHEKVELILIMQKALEFQGTKPIETDSNTAKVLSHYAEMLATEGDLQAALNCLGNSTEPRIVMLKERLGRALGYIQQQTPQPAQNVGRRSISQTYYDQPRKSLTAMSSPFDSLHQQQAPITQQPSWNTTPMNQGYGTSASQFGTLPPVQNFPPQVPGQIPHQDPYSPLSSYEQTAQPQAQAVPPPPPKASQAPSQSSRPPSVGPQTTTSRSKYVVDPSVKSSYGGQSMYQQQQPHMHGLQNSGYGGYQQPSMNPMNSYPAQSTMYSSESDSMGYTAPQPVSMLQPVPNPGQSQIYDPTANQPQPSVQQQSYSAESFSYQNQSQPAGWNDPPTGKSGRNQQKSEFQKQDPIVHPLLGTATQAEHNVLRQTDGYYEPQVPNMPYNSPQQQLPHVHQQPPPQQQTQYPQDMYNPGMQYNNPIVSMEQQKYQRSQVPVAKEPEPEKPKAPIPEEHVLLQNTFDELKNRCLESAKNPQIKRKIEDVSRKLEILYDSLREHKLSSNTLNSLHQICQLIQTGDYTSGLSLHTAMASGADFSQIASFMPGIKVLLQSALQLGVYIR